ncbi:hypothetical protein [Adhaeretor mobilis]|uniref:Glycosyl hydrolase family 32 N-terminal domain-containing protein n=1 Tax=Adhaeretor mobilis TaxID=1930276 RepID=A0A517MZW5_9BACT|nr:hypothetical protein [Adhaeretor mobilis]QDT00394.1 hypothetical protein HG15A2_37300 [Adhaeretor mobilis]
MRKPVQLNPARVLSCYCFVILITLGGSVIAANSPFDVGNKAQLFIDKVIVQEMDGVWLKQHTGTKHPANPIIVADQPWEPWLVKCNTAIYDEEEKLFKMWYSNYSFKNTSPWKANDYFDYGTVCYATSKDGIHWEKPLIGTIVSKNGEPHNAIRLMTHGSVLKDNKDADPNRRYKMIGWRQDSTTHGFYSYISPDGLNWTMLSEKPISRSSDVATGYYDHRLSQYVGFPKHNTTVRGFQRRSFATIFSDDFENWTKPKLSFTNDLRDDANCLLKIEPVRALLDMPDDPSMMRSEFYGIGVYESESCTVALPWILTTNAKARYGNDQGTMEVQLAASRDLLNWERPFRTPIIEFGKISDWDSVNITSPSSALRVNDEIWVYYGGGNQTHGVGEAKKKGYLNIPGVGRQPLRGSIGLATWRLDGFMSVNGPKEGGTLTTVPITFEGERLEINALTKAGGLITVEILDAAGQTLKGWEESDPFSGDEIRHVVTFNNKKDVSELRGRPIILRLNIHDAELYSFAFR